MGGAQQYISNKVKRLQKKGYDTMVFSYDQGDIYIKTLLPYKEMIIPMIRMSPMIYRKKDIENVISVMCEHIGNISDQIFIESTVENQAEWGELLASKIGAKHIFIDLQEEHKYRKEIMDFLYFKYMRKELYGINKDSIRRIFENFYEVEDESLFISAECGNVVEDVACDGILKELPEASYVIGSIGRLDKPFVIQAMQQVILFANLHSDKKFNVLLIGGGSDERIHEIRSMVESTDNIFLYITGFIYPIPKNVIEYVDCFFSSAGSARVSMKEGRPTISMSVDGKAIGILNYTTQDTLYVSGEYGDNLSLAKYLELILFKEYCNTHATLGMEIEAEDMEQEFERQMDFFTKATVVQEYYNMYTILPLSMKFRIYRFMAYILGGKNFDSIQGWLYNVKSSIRRKGRNENEQKN